MRIFYNLHQCCSYTIINFRLIQIFFNRFLKFKMFDWRFGLRIAFMFEILFLIIDTTVFKLFARNLDKSLCAEIQLSNFELLIEGANLQKNEQTNLAIDINKTITWIDKVKTCSFDNLHVIFYSFSSMNAKFDFNFTANKENKTIGLSFINIILDAVEPDQTILNKFSINFPVTDLNFPSKYTRFKCNKHFEFKKINQMFLDFRTSGHDVNVTLKFSNFKSKFYFNPKIKTEGLGFNL